MFNSQKENFLETMQKMSHVEGWEILESENLLALKAPTELPFRNLVWGQATLNNINKIKLFYQDKKFFWLSNKNEVTLERNGFIHGGKDDALHEMQLDIATFRTHETKVLDADVVIVRDHVKLKLWCHTVAKVFNCAIEQIEEFFHPLLNIEGNFPILITRKNKPVSTALIYCGENKVAGIYAMSTVESMRRFGYGTLALNKCIELALKYSMNTVVLYASNFGENVYLKYGFKKVDTFNRYQIGKI